MSQNTSLQNASPQNTSPWPKEIRVKREERVLEVDFDDGTNFAYTAELLRVESPSADVQGHSPSQKVTLAGKRNVGISAIEAVGNYAIRIIFDDGHSTGIFSWHYLYNELGREQENLWAAYLSAVEERGLSRD